MPPNDYPVEPDIPCGCGCVSEVVIEVSGKQKDVCMKCLYKLFPQHAKKIAKAYRAFHVDAYGYEPGGQN